MADLKISQLTARASNVMSDELPVLAGGQNYRSSLTSILALASSGGASSIASYANVAAVVAATIPVEIKTLVTACYATLGHGGAIYNRLPGAPNLMLQVGPHGGTSFGCIRSIDRFTSTGTTDAINGGWWMLDINVQRITPLMFGSLGNSPVLPADDGPGIREAHHFCQWARLGLDLVAPLAGMTYSPYCQYVPLYFPMGRYNINSGVSFQMIDHMKWIGEAEYGDETNFVPMLRYNVSDFFTLTPPGPGSILDPAAPTDRVDWVTIKGICFDGRNQRRCFLKPTSITNSADIKLFHSTFESCGFKNWNHAFCNLLSGVMIRYCFFQNNLCGFKAAGADNIIENNYMSGSNWRPGGTNSAGFPGVTDPAGAPGNTNILPADHQTWAVVLGSFRLSRFNRNYITGMPQMCMKCSHSLDGTIFEQNWFDYADWSLLFLENSRGGTFIGNTFNNGMLGIDRAIDDTPAGKSITGPSSASATYNALIRIANNTHHVNFSNNTFGYYEALTSRDQLPTAPGDPLNYTHSPMTLNITGGSNISDPLNVVQGHSNNITWNNNNYTSDYKFSMVYDDESGPPVIFERGGTGEAGRFPYGRQHTYGFTDCHNTFAATGNGVFMSDVATGGQTGGIATVSPTNPGLLRMAFGPTVAGTTTSYAAIRTGRDMMRFGVGEARCYFVFYEQHTGPTAGEPYSVMVGFHDSGSTSVVPVDGCYFQFNDSNPNWMCIVRANGVDTGTVFDSGVPWAGGGQVRKFKIIVSDFVDYTPAALLPSGNGWVEFYINDVLVAGRKAISSSLPPLEYVNYPVVPNIPIGAGREVGVGIVAAKQGGTAININPLIDLDLIEFEQRLNIQR